MLLFRLVLVVLLCLPLYVELVLVSTVWMFALLYMDENLRTVALIYKCEKRAIAITNEVRKAMPLKVEKQDQEYNYVPLDYREDTRPPAFKMKRLRPIRAAELRDGQFEISLKGKLKSIKMMSVRVRMVIKQLVGWENIEMDGVNVPFDPKDPEGMYDLLPAELQRELEAVFGGGKYSEEAETDFLESKNKDDDDEDDDDDDEEDEDEDDDEPTDV